jgi:hypothetical protein
VAIAKIISIVAILLLFSVNCINFIIDSNENKWNPGTIEKTIIGDSNAQSDNNFLDESRSTRGDKENNVFGGSWVDSFKDDSSIDWGLSDHLNLSNEEVRIKRPLRYYADSNTLAFWRFDEGSGNKAYDDTINNNDGTLLGDTSWTEGRFGKSVYFDGSGNDVIDVPDSNSLDISKEFTIEAWVYRNETQRKDMILAKEHCYYLQIGANDLFFLNMHTNRNNAFYSVSKIPANCWVHVAATANGTTVNIYINGSLDASYKQTVNCAIRTRKLEIGRLYYQPIEWFFRGKMDEIRISNIARDPKPLANLTSKQINLPANNRWDTLIVNATQPRASELNITILNASNNQPIPGKPKIIKKDEYDISYLDPTKYSKIKLNVSFIGNTWGLTPVLHYWGVSWKKSNVWRDTFFGGARVESVDKAGVLDGKAQFQKNGVLQSAPIVLPDKCYYDKLIINKTEPTGSSMIVAVLDAQSETLIPGFNALTNKIIDISGINPHTYPSIKLKAIYSTTGIEKAELFDWSINWTNNIIPEILDISSVLTVNRTRSITITVNLTDLEEVEAELTLNIEYQSPMDTNWLIDYISGPYYINTHWEVIFNPPADADVGDYSFKFTCNDSFQSVYEYPEPYYIMVMNNKPIIWDVQTDATGNQINRTKMMKIYINASDIEYQPNELGINLLYKSQVDTDWQTDFVSKIFFTGPYWICEFVPKKIAFPGLYILNLSVSDDVSEVYQYLDIQVFNNKPILSVLINPLEPKTKDDLNVTIIHAYDVETNTADLEYWYRWSTNGTYRPELDNLSKIPNAITVKGETWQVAVFPFDGDGLGQPTGFGVEIVNTPPIPLEDFKIIEMFEDRPLILDSFLSSIFNDPDDEPLTYLASEGKNISSNITQANGTIRFTSSNNWFGSEYITFYAYDSSPDYAEFTMLVIVVPTNDLPRITKVGDKIVYNPDQDLDFDVNQDEWLNLTIEVEDIDGDDKRGKVKYKLDVIEQDNLYFDNYECKIVFRPKNEDVGRIFLLLNISDNNDTPPENIYQAISIEVYNVNDPPSVEITAPKNELEFFESDKIDLICKVFDADLIIPNATEKISYLWSFNKDNGTDFKDLGTYQQLNNQSFSPGFYNITIKVTDTAGEVAFDFVYINVKEAPKGSSDQAENMTNFLMWSGLLLIILIVILSLSLLKVNFRKKEEKAIQAPPESEVLQPVEIYRLKADTTGVLGTLQSVPQLSQPTAIASTPGIAAKTPELLSPASTSQPAIAQLPPAIITQETQAQPESDIDQQQLEDEEDLPTQLKLDLLEDRFLYGEVDQDIYLNLKAKFEMELKQDEIVGTQNQITQLPQQQKNPIQETIEPDMKPEIEQIKEKESNE